MPAITFGKHSGTELDKLPADYLQWLQDYDKNSQGIIKNGVDWSQLAQQELIRRKKANYEHDLFEVRQVSLTKFSNGTTIEKVVVLTKELVSFVRQDSSISIKEENIKTMLLKAKYDMGTAMSLAGLIAYSAKAALSGKRPVIASNDYERKLYELMDEQGNF